MLELREHHRLHGATFTQDHPCEDVLHYGDWQAEHACLKQTCGLLDLGCRGRICVVGADRVKFLHGQVTNDVAGLKDGEGCYAFLVNAKARIQSDLNIYRLENELLLDFEPGLTEAVMQRLDQYLIADDVQLVDAAPHYSLLSVQGPKSATAMEKLSWLGSLPLKARQMQVATVDGLGEIYVARLARTGSEGFDLFVPVGALETVWNQVAAAVAGAGGRPCGWQALETARVEAGIPRYGQDMTDANLAPETALGEMAIHYKKGCYIGQEIIARVRTYGQAARELRRLIFPPEMKMPVKSAQVLLHVGKEAGHVTSCVWSPAMGCCVGLGYVRKEWHQPGQKLDMQIAGDVFVVEVALLPGGSGA